MAFCIKTITPTFLVVALKVLGLIIQLILLRKDAQSLLEDTLR